MRQWQQTAQVLGHILRHEFPYSKTGLIVAYLRLVASAFGNKFFPSGREIFTRSLLGFKITFRDYTEFVTLFEEIFVYEAYRFRASHPQPRIIDAGSNIGLATLYFKLVFPNCRVMCFEPDTDNLELMKKNIRQNFLDGISIQENALSDTEGIATLYRKNATGTINSSLVYAPNSQPEQQVHCKRLSSLLTEPVHLLKLDIEGSEERVIEELILSRKIQLIDKLIIEHHPLLTITNTHEFVKKLEDAGFLCHLRDFSAGQNEKLIECTYFRANKETS